MGGGEGRGGSIWVCSEVMWSFKRNILNALRFFSKQDHRGQFSAYCSQKMHDYYYCNHIDRRMHFIAQLNVSPCTTCRCTRYSFEKYYVSGHLPPDILQAKYKKFPDKHWGGYTGVTQWTRAMSIGACTAGKINNYFSHVILYTNPKHALGPCAHPAASLTPHVLCQQLPRCCGRSHPIIVPNITPENKMNK